MPYIWAYSGQCTLLININYKLFSNPRMNLRIILAALFNNTDTCPIFSTFFQFDYHVWKLILFGRDRMFLSQYRNSDNFI